MGVSLATEPMLKSPPLGQMGKYFHVHTSIFSMGNPCLTVMSVHSGETGWKPQQKPGFAYFLFISHFKLYGYLSLSAFCKYRGATAAHPALTDLACVASVIVRFVPSRCCSNHLLPVNTRSADNTLPLVSGFVSPNQTAASISCLSKSKWAF